jgi:hypothetical protein
MLNDQRALVLASTSRDDQDPEEENIRDIHALTPPRPPSANRNRTWETSSHRSSSLSVASEGGSIENFTSMSREFNALVLAGSTIGNNGSEQDGTANGNNLGRIGEEDMPEETNPLAIVPDNNPLDPVMSPRRGSGRGTLVNGNDSDLSVQRVKKEEVESKISAWQNAKVAKINNRFKREDAIINGWESEQVQKASSWMKKVEVRIRN